MKEEFVWIEVSFKFNDGDQISGVIRAVSRDRIEWYINAEIEFYRQRYGRELSHAIIRFFRKYYAKSKLCAFLGEPKYKIVGREQRRIA